MVRVLTSIICVFASMATMAIASPGKVLTGTVTDTNRQPLVGASVVIYTDESPVNGGATDQDGKFRLEFNHAYSSLRIKVSSIGYQEEQRSVTLSDSVTVANIQCEPVLVEVQPITVHPGPDSYVQRISLPKNQITKLASRSLVVTNPVAALQHPQLGRIGSSHSSQIRVNGTSPRYYLNGVSIGSDPNHYGMFSVIPATVLHQIDFHPQGTDASYGLPTVVNFMTPGSFEQASHTDLNFSTLEATASFRRSSDRLNIVGALRKSILDQLVNSFDISTERQTIPPTSFSDVYLSTGFKLSGRYQVALDQYHAYDYLAFNTASTTEAAKGVQTYQRARENYFGLRTQAIYSNLLVRATLAVRDGLRSYQALPEDMRSPRSVWIDLAERQRTYLAHVTADAELGQWEFKLGNQLEHVADRLTDLQQRNWNFLPPFATSDNPYIYQSALNRLYDEYHGELSQISNGAYVSVGRAMGRFTMTGGLRSEYYGHLASSKPLLVRLSAGYQLSKSNSATIFYGTFAEDPITAVLEPYQILVRDNVSSLKPIVTELLSIDYGFGPWKVGVFTKTLSQLPVIAPDFDRPFVSNLGVNEDFLRMRSEGKAQFTGGSIAIDLKQLLSPRLSFYGSYAYTHASKTEHEVTYPYETSAPHRFISQLAFKLSRKVTIGSDLQVRSGYRYSPARSLQYWSESSLYNEQYYTKMLDRENSERFATNMTINLHATFDFGSTSLHLAVTNATNRYNQIIKSPSGYVYDAGILPSVGFNWKL